MVDRHRRLVDRKLVKGCRVIKAMSTLTADGNKAEVLVFRGINRSNNSIL
jgi:hypothetical protein